MPKNLQTVIRVAQLPDLAYKTVRKCVGDFIRAGVTYDQLGVSKSARDPDAMDIGFLGPPGSKKTGSAGCLRALLTTQSLNRHEPKTVDLFSLASLGFGRHHFVKTFLATRLALSFAFPFGIGVGSFALGL